MAVHHHASTHSMMKEVPRILSALDQGEPHAAKFVSGGRLITPW
jgi:hypothetical protein